MIKLFRRTSISILDKDWKPIKQGVRLRHIPRYDEIIWVEETQQYYKVLNVVYYLNKKQGVFIIVGEMDAKMVKNEEK
tara:strand:- start:511 stop:744 length:234 start_codon:yes stop_codon:yes gene_type:complete